MNVVNLDSRRKPAITKTESRDYNGMLSAKQQSPTTIHKAIMSEFMMTDLNNKIVTPAQLVNIQTAIAMAFGCKGVFVGLNNTGDTVEILCVPANKDSEGNWHILSFWDFYKERLKKTDVYGVKYKFKNFIELLSRFTKLQPNVTIKVIRKPTTELWNDFQTTRKNKPT